MTAWSTLEWEGTETQGRLDEALLICLGNLREMCECMHIAEHAEHSGDIMPEQESPTSHHAGSQCVPRGHQPETSGPRAAWLGSPFWLDCWKAQRYGQVPLLRHRQTFRWEEGDISRKLRCRLDKLLSQMVKADLSRKHRESLNQCIYLNDFYFF